LPECSLLEVPGGSWDFEGLSSTYIARTGRFWRFLGRGYWKLLEAAGASEGFWRLLAAPGGAIGRSWRLLEAPGSSQAGGPLDLFTKHLRGTNAFYFSPTYPQTPHF